MGIIRKDSQPFEPYARLMNILGDQLITDRKVAVVEIVKNSYDADAENVKVKFFNMDNFGKNYLPVNEQPYIEIEDDGDGMTLEIIKKVWLRPATPNKITKKKLKDNLTAKGRIIQGEKGIGRFAIHKLGEKIELYTKAVEDDEVKLEMDFTDFDPDKADLFTPMDDYKLLNKVFNNWYVNSPAEVINKPKGTVIRIYNLRERWKIEDLEDLYKSIQRLIPPTDENAKQLGINFHQDFGIDLYNNDELFVAENITTFKDVIERAQYTMIGEVDSEGYLEFSYKSQSPVRSFSKQVNVLSREALSKENYVSYSIEKRFYDKTKKTVVRKPLSGPFKFTFYAFDLAKPDRTILNKDIEKFIKDNFVFVLRDGVRVYPYGEKGIDWLNLDKLRSTVRAGWFISYNDLTGFVYISDDHNKLLKDSSNRQGIMDIDGALEDFKSMVTAVTEIFNTEIKIDKNKIELNKKVAIKDSSDTLTKSFNSFKAVLEKTENRDVLEKANSFIDTVHKHNKLMRERMETVEDLAGLGMAVEKASHDSLTLLSTMRANVIDFKIKATAGDYKNENLIALLSELDENLSFVFEEMQIIQPLFKAQRKAAQDVSLVESIEKVVKYFRRDIDGKIDVEIIKSSDLVIHTNKGLILQILINLIDNAIYWVNKNETNSKKITIAIDASKKSFTVADNGPGVREDVTDAIFSEFFSMKTDGRGLGLYIVKEILFRINGEIFINNRNEAKILPGANFVVNFN
ncbi:ATP-binding protein [Flavobacterium wongokense]|uniref:ATP-binding protein n=1 Tax=Flavobacterium wongokense TaxID=2910674 RepID=UPI001F20D556|nr:ATP-binding protein [Flavobacterium sp. WG47]MCF6132741.1 ATP-binding protein [Flavobacterium sp. WG47]